MTNHPNRSAEAKIEQQRFRAVFGYMFPRSAMHGGGAIAWRDFQDLAPTNRAQLMDALEMAYNNKRITEAGSLVK